MKCELDIIAVIIDILSVQDNYKKLGIEKFTTNKEKSRNLHKIFINEFYN